MFSAAGRNGRATRRLDSTRDDELSILQSFQEPMLRYCDVPGAASLCEMRMLHPSDPYLLDIHALVQRDQLRKAAMSGDPFHGNPPPRGCLPAFVQGRIPLALSSNWDVLTVPIHDATKNILAVGPTGSGKTNWLRLCLLSVLSANQDCLAVVFDRKGGEIADCRTLATPGLPLLVIHWSELAIALLQCIRGMSLPAFVTTLVQLISHQFSLFASKRLLGDTLELLYRKPRSRGEWPRLSEWLVLLESIKVNSISRLGQYREAAIFTLKQILRELPVVDYTSSDFFERMFALRGAVVVVTSGLSVEMESFLASLFINYAYHRREGFDTRTLAPLIFVLDDAMPLVHGSSMSESEGGVNPIATWSFMGRSRGTGIVVAAQNFSAISPALRNNADTILCFGSYGRDAEELARHFSLSREQAALLPTLRPGEVVAMARATWPLPVRGRLPEVL